MEGALKSMNLEQISSMLDRFEKSFENLDVQSQVMEETVGGITAQSVPEASVQVNLTDLFSMSYSFGLQTFLQM